MKGASFAELAHQNEALQLRLSYLTGITQRSLEKLTVLAETAVAAAGSLDSSRGARASDDDAGQDSWLKDYRQLAHGSSSRGSSGGSGANGFIGTVASRGDSLFEKTTRTTEEARRVVVSVCESIQREVQQAQRDIQLAQEHMETTIPLSVAGLKSAAGKDTAAASAQSDAGNDKALTVALVNEKAELAQALRESNAERDEAAKQLRDVRSRYEELLRRAAYVAEVKASRKSRKDHASAKGLGSLAGTTNSDGSRAGPRSATTLRNGADSDDNSDEDVQLGMYAMKQQRESRVRELESVLVATKASLLQSQQEVARLQHIVQQPRGARSESRGGAPTSSSAAAGGRSPTTRGAAAGKPNKLKTPVLEESAGNRATSLVDTPPRRGGCSPPSALPPPSRLLGSWGDDQPGDELAEGCGGGDGSGRGSAVDAPVSQLKKQNVYLRAKVDKLKEELRISRLASVGSTKQMHEGLDTLLLKIDELQRVSRQQEDTISALRVEKVVMSRENAQLKRHVEELVSSERRQGGTSVPSPCGGSNPAADSEVGKSDSREFLEFQRQLLAEQVKVANQDTELQMGRSKITFLEGALKEKELRCEALQIQHDQLERKLAAALATNEQAKVHEDFLQGVRLQLNETSNSIAVWSSAEGLQKQLMEVRERLREMDGMELQLRQKMDEVAILTEEKEEVEARVQQLTQSLTNISILFSRIPLSVSAVEFLIVQKEVYESELRRCSLQSDTPDLQRLQSVLDLRMLELEAKRVELGINASSSCADGGLALDVQPYVNEDEARRRQIRANQRLIANTPHAAPHHNQVTGGGGSGTESGEERGGARTRSRRPSSAAARASSRDRMARTPHTTDAHERRAAVPSGIREGRRVLSPSGRDRRQSQRDPGGYRSRSNSRSATRPRDQEQYRVARSSSREQQREREDHDLLRQYSPGSGRHWAAQDRQLPHASVPTSLTSAALPERLDFSPSLLVEVDECPVWSTEERPRRSESAGLEDITSIPRGSNARSDYSYLGKAPPNSHKGGTRSTSPPQLAESRSRTQRGHSKGQSAMRERGDHAKDFTVEDSESMADEIERLLHMPLAPPRVDLRDRVSRRTASSGEGKGGSAGGMRSGQRHVSPTTHSRSPTAGTAGQTQRGDVRPPSRREHTEGAVASTQAMNARRATPQSVPRGRGKSSPAPAATASRKGYASPSSAKGREAPKGPTRGKKLERGDAELIFDLFDKQKTGKLSYESVRLCLSALGCKKRLPRAGVVAAGGGHRRRFGLEDDETGEADASLTKDEFIRFLFDE